MKLEHSSLFISSYFQRVSSVCHTSLFMSLVPFMVWCSALWSHVSTVTSYSLTTSGLFNSDHKLLSYQPSVYKSRVGICNSVDLMGLWLILYFISLFFFKVKTSIVPPASLFVINQFLHKSKLFESNKTSWLWLICIISRPNHNTDRKKCLKKKNMIGRH